MAQQPVVGGDDAGREAAGLMRETIFALSSGALPAGVAVVRVSGPKALAVLRTLAGGVPPPRVASLRTIADDALVIDRALVLAFPAPHSATGEDVAEFHLHGGTAVVAALFGALVRHGLRLAAPGEFTRRAYDNGQLDLSQVEGLADLVAAETEGQRRAALTQAGGALRETIDAWRSRVLDLLADAEADLDFADGEDDVASRLDDQSNAVILELIADIDAELARAGRGRALRDGLMVVVTGPPNVGKSSLVNVLARRDVAIVSPIAGTTRDAVEARLDLGGIMVTLVDTAGLRETSDLVEAAGIARTRARAASADLVLTLFCNGPEPNTSGWAVRTKADLGGSGEQFTVSSLTGIGIEALEMRLTRWASTIAKPNEPALITQERHRAACTVARAELAAAQHEADPVLRAEALRLAMRALGEVTGLVGVEMILDMIFARFCIGK